MKRLKNIIRNININLRANRRIFWLITVLRVLVVLSMVRAIFNGNYNGAFVCLLSLLLFLVPSLMENGFNIHIPPVFEGSIYLFIYAAEILGEINHFYAAIPGWDTILHTINGFLAAAVGFSMIDLLNRNSKNISLSPFYLAMVAFCFSMTIGVLWEFLEFSADNLLHMDMQKDFIISSIHSVTLDPSHSQHVVHIHDIISTQLTTASGQTYTIDGGYLDIGIIDTMKDLFVNFIGAVCFSTLGYWMLRHKDRYSRAFASNFIWQAVPDETDESNYMLTSDGFTADDDDDSEK
ncbi:MAG: hypothetical protein Q4C56_05855 [Peptococcaceae bacterium]|nr:hypothetical protein [Peptococcaceae bacterium]